MMAFTLFMAFLMLNLAFAMVGYSGIFPSDFVTLDFTTIIDWTFASFVIAVILGGISGRLLGADPLKVGVGIFLCETIYLVYDSSFKILLSIGKLIDAGSVSYGTFFIGILIIMSILSFTWFILQVLTQGWRGIVG